MIRPVLILLTAFTAVRDTILRLSNMKLEHFHAMFGLLGY